MTSEAKGATGATGLADRYAAALFDLAEEKSELDQVAADLAALTAMISGSPDLTRLIRSPVIPRADQQRALDAIMVAAGLGQLVRNFAGVAAANRRLFALPAMIVAFRALLAARRGETTAQVVSATGLTNDQQAAIADALRRALGTKVAVEAKIDPGLLGGLVVKVGSRLVDNSLRTRLERLRFAMKGVA